MKLHVVNLWIGGDLLELTNGGTRYVGGTRFRSPKVSLDFFSESKLMDYYRFCGGRGMSIEFYYLEPGFDMTYGLRPLDNPWAFVQMQEDCCDQNEVTVYAVKGPPPLCALDVGGNDITHQAVAADQGVPILMLGAEEVQNQEVQFEEVQNQEVQFEEIQNGEVQVEEIQVEEVQVEENIMQEEEVTQEGGIPGAEDIHPTEPSSSRPHATQTTPEVEDPTVDLSCHFDNENQHTNCEHIGNKTTDVEMGAKYGEEPELGDDYELGNASGNEADDENMSDADADGTVPLDDPELEPCTEMAEEFRQTLEAQRKGKQIRDNLGGDPEESPGDSDDDLWDESNSIASEDESLHSEPSDCYSDIEGSQEDDIFIHRDVSKLAKKKKLAEMRKKQRLAKNLRAEVNVEEATCQANEGGNWYTDVEEDDNFDQPPLSDTEAKRVSMFKDGDSIDDLKLHVGLCFASFEKYKDVLSDWSIRKGFVLDYLKCERTRVTAKCKGQGCQWRIHASLKQNSRLFEVKTLKGQHTCARGLKNFRASAAYIAGRMQQTIKDHPDVRISTLQNIVQRVVGVEITHSVAQRAKKMAMDKLRGENEAEFGLLWDYCETVRAKNPGSTVFVKAIEDSSPPRFDRMYYSLAAMKQGFLDGCRPLIGLDGCFIKTVHGGQLLSAIGKDGNDNLFPIALAYVRSENSNTWKWFIEILLADLGGQEGGKWTFISDRQKGLLDALEELAPECEHRYCLRHLYQNFSVRWKSQNLKSLFWKAAAASNKEEWRDIMQQIKALDSSQEDVGLTAYDWLMDLHPSCWSRAFFRTTCKSDVLVNNICESWNNLILPAREKAVVGMFEWIRIRIMNRFGVKRLGMGTYEGIICPNLRKKLNKNCNFANNCIPQWAGGCEFEVQMHEDQYIVKLDERTCTCGSFQLNDYPCCHAYPCITYKREEIEDYIDDCYKKPAYEDAYKHVVHGVGGRKHYIKTAEEPLKGPEYKPKMGRPRKARRKSANEGVSSSRVGLTHICSRCFILGHNVKTCNNPPHPNSRFYTVGLTSLDTATRRPTVRSQRGRRRTAFRAQNQAGPSNTSAGTNFQSTRGRRRVFNARQQMDRAIRARADARARVAAANCNRSPSQNPPVAAQSQFQAASDHPQESTPISASQVPRSRLTMRPPPHAFQSTSSAVDTSPTVASAQAGTSTPTTHVAAEATGTSTPSAANAAPSTEKQPRRVWNKRTTEEEAFRNVRGRAQARRQQAPWKP